MKAVSRLQGKRIAVTRAAERAEGLALALRAEGVEVRICPTIAYDPPEDPALLEAALQQIDRYDWVVFTSAAAVDALAEQGALPRLRTCAWQRLAKQPLHQSKRVAGGSI